MLGFGDERQDGEAPASAARASSTLNCTTQDNCCAARGNGDDQTSNLKDCDTGQKNSLEGKVLVCLSPERLEGSQAHEEGRSIPTDLILAMKSIRDRRDGCGDDGLKESLESSTSTKD
jgi:hypothetical protein